MNYKIRKAIATDITEIIKLCAEHAEYEKANYDATGKSEKLFPFLFGDNPKLHCLIAENENQVLGYATYSYEMSTWDAAQYAHMDCLYLRPLFRSFGIGEALVKEIAREAKKNDCRIMQWQTPIFNERAIKFYYRIGATSKEKLRLYVDEATIHNLTK